MTQEKQEAFHSPTTTKQRFWRAMGFRYNLVDLPDNIHDSLPGWMITKTVFHFDFVDRVRILLSGKMSIDIRQATSQQVDECVSAISFCVVPPGEKP